MAVRQDRQNALRVPWRGRAFRDTRRVRATDRGRLQVLSAAVLWGTTGTAQALAPASASSEAIGAVRMAVGGAALLVLALATGAFRGLDRWPRGALLAAAAGMGSYQPLFFSGVARTGVAVGTIAAIGSAPVFAGALARALEGGWPGRRWAVATALAVGGTSLLAIGGRRADVDPVGVAFALGAGLCYAVYATAAKRLLAGRPPVAVAGAVFPLAAVGLSPILFASDLGWLAAPRGLAVALHLGLVATALAYVLFSTGLGRVPAPTAVTLSLAEPLTAAALGVALLGERPGPAALAGAALVLAGLAVLAAPRPALTRPRAPAGSPPPG